MTLKIDCDRLDAATIATWCIRCSVDFEVCHVLRQTCLVVCRDMDSLRVKQLKELAASHLSGDCNLEVTDA